MVLSTTSGERPGRSSDRRHNFAGANAHLDNFAVIRAAPFGRRSAEAGRGSANAHLDNFAVIRSTHKVRFAQATAWSDNFAVIRAAPFGRRAAEAGSAKLSCEPHRSRWSGCWRKCLRQTNTDLLHNLIAF